MNTSADAVGKGPERQHVAALKLVGQILLIWVAIWFGSLLISFMAWKVFGFINDRDTKLFAQVIAGVGSFLLAPWRVTGFWRRKGLAITPSVLIHLLGGFLMVSTPLPDIRASRALRLVGRGVDAAGPRNGRRRLRRDEDVSILC